MKKEEESLFNNKELINLIFKASTIADTKGFHEDFNEIQKLWLMITELAEATEADRELKFTSWKEFDNIISGEDDCPVHVSFDEANQPIGSSIGKEGYTYNNIKDIPNTEQGLLIKDFYISAAYKKLIKDSFGAELAGFLVRVGDFIAHLKIEGVKLDESVVWPNIANLEDLSTAFLQLAGQIFAISFKREYADPNDYSAEDFTILCSNMISICKQLKVPIWKHIKYELLYFSTRPHKHGKKY